MEYYIGNHYQNDFRFLVKWHMIILVFNLQVLLVKGHFLKLGLQLLMIEQTSMKKQLLTQCSCIHGLKKVRNNLTLLMIYQKQNNIASLIIFSLKNIYVIKKLINCKLIIFLCYLISVPDTIGTVPGTSAGAYIGHVPMPCAGHVPSMQNPNVKIKISNNINLLMK